MIDHEQAKKLAVLARLDLSAEELKGLEEDLNRILEYVGRLEKVDTANVSATFHATATPNILRDDTEAVSTPEKAVEHMLGQAPERKDGYIKVKAVL